MIAARMGAKGVDVVREKQKCKGDVERPLTRYQLRTLTQTYDAGSLVEGVGAAPRHIGTTFISQRRPCWRTIKVQFNPSF